MAVYYGAKMLSATPDVTLSPTSPSFSYGSAIAVGDFDGNGFPDVAVGDDREAKVYVYAPGDILSTEPDVTLEGDGLSLGISSHRLHGKDMDLARSKENLFEPQNGEIHEFSGIRIHPKEDFIVLFDRDGFTGPTPEDHLEDVVFLIVAKGNLTYGIHRNLREQRTSTPNSG